MAAPNASGGVKAPAWSTPHAAPVRLGATARTSLRRFLAAAGTATSLVAAQDTGSPPAVLRGLDPGAKCGSTSSAAKDGRRSSSGCRSEPAAFVGSVAMRVAVPLAKSYRLLNHGPTTLVSTAHAGRQNVMAAAWVMPLDFEPTKFVAVVAGDTFTRELLDASGECVLQAPTNDQLALTMQLGSHSGRDGDKLARFGVATEPASLVGAPLVRGCACWLECRVLPEAGIAERYDLFVLECVAAWADDELFRDGSWRFAPGGRRTIHHVKGGEFFTTGERVVAPR
jgi:flavin reductase (DIM6/NTAB) family NADH-FMN oxidoreductase RutF